MRRQGPRNLPAAEGSHSGLFGQARASTSLFKHSLKSDGKLAGDLKQPDHLYITNQNYESKFDTTRGDVSASSRRFSTKQSHALLTQSTSSRIREMQEEQRLAGVSNIRLFRFFEEQSRLSSSKVDTRRSEQMNVAGKRQLLRQKQQVVPGEALRNKHAVNFNVTGRQNYACGRPLQTALPQKCNHALGSDHKKATDEEQLRHAITKQQDVKPTSRKLNDVLQMAQQLGKRRSEHVSAVLSSLVAEAKKDYVDGTQKIDATPSEIEVELKKIDKQQPSRRVFPQRPSDLQILHMPKLKALYDHSGSYLSTSGYKIDNYALPKENSHTNQGQVITRASQRALPKRRKRAAIAQTAGEAITTEPSGPTAPLKTSRLPSTLPPQEVPHAQEGHGDQALYGQRELMEPEPQATSGVARSTGRRTSVLRMEATREQNKNLMPLL